MVDGTPTDYPSGKDLDNARRPSAQISSAGSSPSWHPKLTLYRLLVILSTVGLAVAKTVTSYLNLSFASITLEWILGVVVFLFLHLLGAYEETSNRRFTWLFNSDYMEYLWVFLGNRTGFRRPYYISDEIPAQHRLVGIRPPLTGYRIIVTVVVASVGMIKSALLYGQKPMEATTVECVFGVGIATVLYWIGLYEASSIKVYPKLFHVDYSEELSYILRTAITFLKLLAMLVSTIIFFLLRSTAIVIRVGPNGGIGIVRPLGSWDASERTSMAGRF
ncbi:hypothetical protein M413DRAFT_28498 [Hebeloma cylindrosporum]|uniref:Uncharacterized protein n=1 Tax=Hebeloma cylindrosporum TaxID=76867 RepID=A0A0C3CAV7_HEBCY|nr:hypothetical protein M413DRAFT_28498 [Hebeloma cylindrosporum h7]